MVNMYSMGMMGGGMYGMGGMNNGPQVNVHEQLKQRYGVGYEDFGTRPYAQQYPMGIVPRAPKSKCTQNVFCRFIKKCFA